jgi:non-heme chloroperoxidase
MPDAQPSPALVTLAADDGVPLSYAIFDPPQPPHATSSSPTPTTTILLLHGWSGSRRYWDPVVPHLLAAGPGVTVVAPDLRWHGDSGRPPAGHTVTRLADDLAALLTDLRARRPGAGPVTAVGASMGAAVLWAHAARHASDGLARLVFVDQAPLQNRAPGWALGSKGCYDDATLAALQAAVRGDARTFAAGNAAACLAQPIPPELADLVADETVRCDGDDLAVLMADHTAADWRPVLPGVRLEALVIVGARSAIFPPAGCTAVADLMPPGRAGVVSFEGGGHWLYLEQPGEFAGVVADFAVDGLAGVEKYGGTVAAKQC